MKGVRFADIGLTSVEIVDNCAVTKGLVEKQYTFTMRNMRPISILVHNVI